MSVPQSGPANLQCGDCDGGSGGRAHAFRLAHRFEDNEKCNNRQQIAQELHTFARSIRRFRDAHYLTAVSRVTRRLEVHPTHPQQRLLRHAAEVLREDGVAIYPTDSTYALGCALGARDAQVRIHRIRGDQGTHFLTLLCRDLSELATYARVGNQAYRLLRALTPGPYTFVLTASRELPRRILDPRRKTIGLRIPDHPVTQGLLEELGSPLLSASLVHELVDEADADPDALYDRYGALVDVFVAAGGCGIESTTMLDLVDESAPRLLRQGRGDVSRIAGLD